MPTTYTMTPNVQLSFAHSNHSLSCHFRSHTVLNTVPASCLKRITNACHTSHISLCKYKLDIGFQCPTQVCTFKPTFQSSTPPNHLIHLAHETSAENISPPPSQCATSSHPMTINVQPKSGHSNPSPRLAPSSRNISERPPSLLFADLLHHHKNINDAKYNERLKSGSTIKLLTIYYPQRAHHHNHHHQFNGPFIQETSTLNSILVTGFIHVNCVSSTSISTANSFPPSVNSSRAFLNASPHSFSCCSM
jgi:hypothetical protein